MLDDEISADARDVDTAGAVTAYADRTGDVVDLDLAGAVLVDVHRPLHPAYVDADGCSCTYIGDESAYQNYQNLVQQKRAAQADLESAEVNEDAAIVEEDGMWESWGGDAWGGGAW